PSCPRRRAPARPFYCTPPAPPEIHPLSLHDALPISASAQAEKLVWLMCDLDFLEARAPAVPVGRLADDYEEALAAGTAPGRFNRSEEHTSELQSLTNIVCRLLLGKKKTPKPTSNRRP